MFSFWQVFGVAFVKRQAIGVFIGLLGCLVLIFSGANVNPHQNYWFVGFVLVASVCYSINVNLIKQYMQNIHPIGITVGNFIGIMIPAFIVLMFSDFPFSEVTSNPKLYNALGYVVLLAIIGTCMAKVLFNKLVQMSSAIFATSVTYLIPIVALFWGVLDNEDFGFWQFVGMGIILFGVFLVNSGKKKV